MSKKKKIDKSTFAISVFMLVLTITMPIVFTALQPEIQGNDITQNSSLDFIPSLIKKTISFFDLIPSVSAEVGCCIDSKQGYCLVVEDTLCNVNQGFYANESCENYCLGCCVDTLIGSCLPFSAQQTCIGQNSIFNLGDATCEQVPSCKLGCCSKGYEKTWTTNSTCTSQYHGTWNGNIPTEQECYDSVSSDTFGCCTIGCEYETADDCAKKVGLVAGELKDWQFVQKKCYQDVPGCSRCGTSSSKQSCMNNSLELFKADDCGNAYADEVLKKCTTQNPSMFCKKGGSTGEKDDCVASSCTTIYSNYNSLSEFNSMAYSTFPPKNQTITVPHGTSWCAYDTALDLGNGTSARGSRNLRHYCLYGQDYSEPCDEGRTSVCLETTGGCFGEDTSCFDRPQSSCSSPCTWVKAHMAVCIPNTYQVCYSINTSEECNSNPYCYWWTQWLDQKTPANVQGLLQSAGFNINQDLGQQASGFYGFDPIKKPLQVQPQLCLPRWPIDYNENTAPTACGQAAVICTYSEVFFGADTENKECKNNDKWDVLNFERCRAVGNCGLWKNWNNQVVGEGSVKKIQASEMPNNTNEARGKNVSMPTVYLDYINQLNLNPPQPSTLNGWNTAGTAVLVLGAIPAIAALVEAGGIGVIFHGIIHAVYWVAELIMPGATHIPAAGGAAAAGGVGAVLAGVALIAVGFMMIGWAQNFPIGSAAHNLLMTGGAGFISAGTVVLISAFVSIPGVGWVALGAAAIIFAITQLVYWLTYKKEYYVAQCQPSRAPVGSDQCHVCNEDSMRPCSKYRCEILGLNCEFNDTVTIGLKSFPLGDGYCYSTINDGLAPWITKIDVTDLQGNLYKAEPSTTTGPQTITITKQDGGAIEDLTDIIVKITLNEKSFCQWDTQTKTNISVMTESYGNGVFGKELSSPFTAHQLQPDYYIRCADAYGNENVAEYIFKFATTEGPDIQAPYIYAVDPENSWEFPNNMSDIIITLALRDSSLPAKCTFSRLDSSKSYDTMLAETSKECYSTYVGPSIVCKFSGIILTPDVSNNFHFKCKDNLSNVNLESTSVSYIASPPLKITSVEPETNSKVEGCELSSQTLVRVGTVEGSDSGKAICKWTNISTEEPKYRFIITDSTVHETNVTLNPGLNTIYIKCTDKVGSSASEYITISVIEDRAKPEITRFYKEGSELVLETNEPATCVYNKNTGCDFDATHWLNAIKFSSNGLIQSTAWRNEPWNVKCYDACNNGLLFGDCVTIIPSSLE